MSGSNSCREPVGRGHHDKYPTGKRSKTWLIIIMVLAALLVMTFSGCLGTANQPPNCYLLASPNFGNHPLNVTFSLGASDTDGSIASWTLDVDGDGASEYSGSGGPPQILDHTYEFSGEYSPTLKVTDDGGRNAEASDSVSVL